MSPLLQALAALLRIALGAEAPVRAHVRARLPAAMTILFLLLVPYLPASVRAALCRIPALRRLAHRAGLRVRLAHLPYGDAIALRVVRDWQLAGPPGRGMRATFASPRPWPPAGPVRAPPLRAPLPSLNTPPDRGRFRAPMEQEESRFLFEKRNQKTFPRLRPARTPEPSANG